MQVLGSEVGTPDGWSTQTQEGDMRPPLEISASGDKGETKGLYKEDLFSKQAKQMRSHMSWALLVRMSIFEIESTDGKPMSRVNV